MGKALFGLQGMSSDCIELRELLSALSKKAHNCKEDFSAQNVSKALHGLLRMSDVCSEVRDML